MCSKCLVLKPESDFYTRPDNGKLRNDCKTCRSKANESWRHENPEALKASKAASYIKNKDQVKEKSREYYENNREQILAWKRDFQANNRPQINQQKKRKYHSDPCFKLSRLLRCRVRDALAGKSKKSAKTVELLGAPWVWVEAYLEEQFVSGMSWENHGPVWEIDHIRPCASFDLTDPEQQKMCFHWTNLQPLFTSDNRRKSDKYDPLNV